MTRLLNDCTLDRAVPTILLHLGLCAGLATAIIHRVRRVRGHHYQLSAELPAAPISADTILSNGWVRGEPEPGQQLRTVSFPPATETDRTPDIME